MFSAFVFFTNRVFWPKNGPVPRRPVNGYNKPFRRADLIVPLALPRETDHTRHPPLPIDTL